ncbi:MAG: hypothetical protein ACQEQ4_06360 [Fibrobacterota bacterium]
MLELLAELEGKLNDLFTALSDKNRTIEDLEKSQEEKDSYIHELEEENSRFQDELTQLKGDVGQRDERFNEAARRMKSIINRINENTN